MGALAHYLESEGLPTASISLIRSHTETIRPPRALWVPFELGRPLGVPGDVAFQTRVLRALLDLFSTPKGPVLVDYPEDAPGAGASDLDGMACPISFSRPEGCEGSLEAAVRREIRDLEPWYHLAKERRGRTTFGVAGLSIEEVAAFLCAWASGIPPSSPVADQSSDALLKLAAEDLKVYYLEAASAQPQTGNSRQLAEWFWGQTSAAQLFLELREACMSSEDSARKWIGQNLMVPREQWSRFGIDDRWWHKPHTQ